MGACLAKLCYGDYERLREDSRLALEEAAARANRSAIRAAKLELELEHTRRAAAARAAAEESKHAGEKKKLERDLSNARRAEAEAAEASRKRETAAREEAKREAAARREAERALAAERRKAADERALHEAERIDAARRKADADRARGAEAAFLEKKTSLLASHLKRAKSAARLPPLLDAPDSTPPLEPKSEPAASEPTARPRAKSISGRSASTSRSGDKSKARDRAELKSVVAGLKSSAKWIGVRAAFCPFRASGFAGISPRDIGLAEVFLCRQGCGERLGHFARQVVPASDHS